MDKLNWTMGRRLATATALGLLLGTGTAQAQGSEALDRFIETRMAEAHVPGVAVAVVKHSRLWWAQGYGWANIQNALPVTADTPFMMASVSKTVTGTALMQLAEDGLFDLDGDVDPFLPFSVRNPTYPTVPITFRHLLAHVSSIRDNWGVMSSLYVSGDSPIPLGQFLTDYFDREGAYYNQSKNWIGQAPGAKFEYSNIGFALVGYLVEVISGQPFDTYCDQNLFAPLGMANTGWHLADFDPSQVAMPYQYSQGSYTPYGQFGFPDYPNGQLRTSVRDMARFLSATIDFGQFPAFAWHPLNALPGVDPFVRILAPRTAALMRVVQYPALDANQCLAFYTWLPGAGNPNGEARTGHSGGDSGVLTEMWFRPGDGVGVIMLANGDAYQWSELLALLAIVDRLFDEASAGTLPATQGMPEAVGLRRLLAPRRRHGPVLSH